MAEVDVLVVGGGTAGGPAAIAAAGEGKTTMVLEWLYVMGGVTTEGRIGRYYKANPRGFTKNFVDAYSMNAEALGDCFYEAKSEAFRKGAYDRGAEIVLGAMAEGAVVEGVDEDGRIKVGGVVAVFPDGTRGVVKAKAIVDATGNADIAAAAGADTMFLSPVEFAMQGSAASTHILGDSYRNSDLGFLNTLDAGDISHFAKRARRGTPDASWNLSNVIAGSRERRRIVGDFIVTELDEMRDRTYTDTVMHGESNYDMHGFSTSDLMMFFSTTHGEIFKADLPYRALVPAKLEGVYATGLSISATRDAMPIIRMQPSVQNQGYAVGIAAAMACDAGGVRKIDIKALQRRFVQDGCLDERVLTDMDSGDDKSGMEYAVKTLDADFRGMGYILSFPDDARGILQEAYESETDAEAKVAKGAALMMIGDDRAFDAITNHLAGISWEAGSNFRGLGNFGRQTAFDDCLLFALAHSGDPRAEGVLADYANRLADSATVVRNLSHWRMIALAAERMKSPRIAANIALAAERGGTAVEGAAKSGVPDSVAAGGENNTQDSERTKVIRELAELRARHRLGDEAATAKLRKYLDDYRTIYAEWAALALNEKPLGKIVGEWKDANTLEIYLGKPSDANYYSGTIEVSDATLRFVADADEEVDAGWIYSPVPNGSFEPLAPLTGAQANLDKRGNRDAAWLAENVPDWTFGKADTVGLTTDGSYFASDNRIGARGHAAFLFKTSSSGNPGTISQTLTVPEGGGEYALAYDFVSRYYGKTFTAQVVTLLDGKEVDCFPGNASTKYDSWQTRTVELGMLDAGEHEIGFTIPSVNDMGVLIDNVSIGVPEEAAPKAEFPKDLLAGLTLKISSATNLVLQGDFNLQVLKFYRDGGRVLGEILATDEGGGSLFTKRIPFEVRIR
ncbi:MAG: FAD-dependent oxidoreductase [Kiritimatiellae bacterium]|nr:FAD-dependent oxidoreductase [Kiritimatiellia bacterium]